jgi:hypothetical protein
LSPGTDVAGYYTRREFDGFVDERMRIINVQRAAIRSQIDFSRQADHTYAELLYVSFFEPSLDRLAREWNMPVEQAAHLLRDAPTHFNEEFPFLGSKLYSRKDVDRFTPHKTVAAPPDAREPSPYEPDLLK